MPDLLADELAIALALIALPLPVRPAPCALAGLSTADGSSPKRTLLDPSQPGFFELWCMVLKLDIKTGCPGAPGAPTGPGTSSIYREPCARIIDVRRLFSFSVS